MVQVCNIVWSCVKIVKNSFHRKNVMVSIGHQQRCNVIWWHVHRSQVKLSLSRLAQQRGSRVIGHRFVINDYSMKLDQKIVSILVWSANVYTNTNCSMYWFNEWTSYTFTWMYTESSTTIINSNLSDISLSWMACCSLEWRMFSSYRNDFQRNFVFDLSSVQSNVVGVLN